MEINEMETQINKLSEQMTSLETTVNGIKASTEDLVNTFAALKGAWVVLNFIGKLAKPITVLGSLFAAWHIVKGLK